MAQAGEKLGKGSGLPLYGVAESEHTPPTVTSDSDQLGFMWKQDVYALAGAGQLGGRIPVLIELHHPGTYCLNQVDSVYTDQALLARPIQTAEVRVLVQSGNDCPTPICLPRA